jgi:RHS repeat-associated protein
VSGIFSVRTILYDDNGSVETKDTVRGNGTSQTVDYTYNLQGRLETVTTKEFNASAVEISSSTAAYKYNTQGIRISKDVDGTVTDYLIDPSNHTGYAQVLEERAGSDVTYYTIGDDVLAQTTGGVTQYLLYDGHGSTRQLLNSNLTIADAYSYDSYGVMLGGNPTAASPAATNLLYSGEQFDSNAQQYYLRARYYNQNNGTFNRVDPYSGDTQDPQSLHKYAYCHNNPVNGIDPTGEFSVGGFALGTLNVAGIVLTAVSIGLKAYSIGIGMRYLSFLPDLMLRLSRTPIDPITLLQIRNHVFLLALEIIGEIAGTALSIVKDLVCEFAFAIAATALIAAASGLIRGVARGVKIGITKFINARKMAKVRKLGKLGEEAAGIIAERKQSIPSLTGTAEYRIPDELTDLHLREVKNVKYLSKTKQVQDFLLYAQDKGLDFILEVRKTTKISKPLLDLEKAGTIIIKRTL